MSEGSIRESVSEVISKTKRRVGAETPSAADDDGHVGIVRGALRAFGEGDMDGFLDALKEDVEWEAPEGKHFPGGGNQSGREAVKGAFVADAGRTYSSFGFRPESFFDADDDDAVLVLGRFVGEGVEGSNVDSPAVQVWEFEGNSAARVMIVADSASFPKVVTEKDEKEKEQKEKEEKEKEEQGKGDDETNGSEAKTEKSDEKQSGDQEGADKHSDEKKSTGRDPEGADKHSDEKQSKNGDSEGGDREPEKKAEHQGE